MSAEVRQRVPKTSGTGGDAAEGSSPIPKVKSSGSALPISLLDILRVITLLLCASAAASWFITKNDIWWGYGRPPFTTVGYWQHKWHGELVLTPLQLAAYDGSDPKKPLLLAVNGTIYDVSKGRHFYGPGGTYRFFSGHDGTRAFVTGCFADDITPDLRGAELMFTPVDDPEIDSLYTKGELKKLKERERRMARKEVEGAVAHWAGFFAKSKKYQRVGRVVGQEGEWQGEVRKLCKKAEEGRPKRKKPEGYEEKKEGEKAA